jgi:hypothetical protein
MRHNIGELRCPLRVLFEAASISDSGECSKLITSLMASPILKREVLSHGENLGGDWRLAQKPNEMCIISHMVLIMTKSKCFKHCLSDTLPLPQ